MRFKGSIGSKACVAKRMKRISGANGQPASGPDTPRNLHDLGKVHPTLLSN